MTFNTQAVGIVSTGVYIPDTFMTSADVAAASGLPREVVEEKLGFRRKPVPGPGDHTVEMGIRAARRALDKGGVAPRDIDLVIYIGEEYKEHLLQTAAIKLQAGIGADRAWGFDVALRCGTTMLGLKLARDLMLANERLNTVLLAGGYRNGDFIDYRNPRVRFMYNLAAGGAAVLLRRGLAENEVLATRIVTDGSLADDVGVTAGGTRVPLTVETLEKGLYTLDVFDPEGMKQRLEERSMPNFLRVIDDSLAESGYSRTDIGYLCLLHMKRSAHDYILSELGLRPEQSIYLEDYGHIGQMDQVLSLELALEAGRVRDGDVVVMVSAGIGYAWAATTIRWGKGRAGGGR